MCAKDFDLTIGFGVDPKAAVAAMARFDARGRIKSFTLLPFHRVTIFPHRTWKAFRLQGELA